MLDKHKGIMVYMAYYVMLGITLTPPKKKSCPQDLKENIPLKANVDSPSLFPPPLPKTHLGDHLSSTELSQMVLLNVWFS